MHTRTLRRLGAGLVAVVGAATLAQPTDVATGLSGGWNDADTPPANAVVRLESPGGSSCTGTLVTPEIVMTASHCGYHSGAKSEDDPYLPAGTVGQPAQRWQPVSDIPADNRPVIHIGPDRAGLRAVGTSVTGFSQFAVERIGLAGPVSHGDTVALRTTKDFYLVAEGGGGSWIGSNREWVGLWEKFVVYRLTGAGPVRAGDRVVLRTSPTAGSRYLTLDRDGRGGLSAITTTMSNAAVFVIGSPAGDPSIDHHDFVTLRAEASGRYLVADNHAGGSRVTRTVSEFAIAGWEDIELLRLNEPVPADVARPIPVYTGDPQGRWSTDRLVASAWGGIDAAGRLSRYRQTGHVQWIRYPDGAALGQFFGLGRGELRNHGGDSGSPLIWCDPSGRYFVIGVLQGSDSDRGFRYSATFSTGGWDPEWHMHPDVRTWLHNATAAG